MKPEEFCSGVKILLERMQSNPEDFEIRDYDFNQMRNVQGRFYEFAKYMECIVTGKNKQQVLEQWTEWHMLSRAEHNALIDGFKTMRRNKFDSGILTRLMDADFEKRQRDAIEEERQARATMMQNAMLKNPTPLTVSAQLAQPATALNNVATGSGGGILSGLGLGGLLGSSR